MDRAAIITQIMNTKGVHRDLGLKLQERTKELFVQDEKEVQTAQYQVAMERIARIRAGLKP